MSSGNNKVLFFDLFKDGHRVSHLQSLINEIEENSYEFKAYFLIHPDLIGKLFVKNNLSDKYEVISFSRQFENALSLSNKSILSSLNIIFEVERIASAHNCSFIFYLHIDSVLLGLSLRSIFKKSRLTTGLTMTQTIHYPSEFKSQLSFKEHIFAKIKFLLLSRLIKNSFITKVGSLDRYFASYAREKLGDRIFHVQDFAPIPHTIEIPNEALDDWVAGKPKHLMFGAIDARKGILLLLDTLLARAENNTDDATYLIVGKVSPDIKERLKKLQHKFNSNLKSDKLIVIDRYITDEELAWLVKNTDYVLAPYLRHKGSSGVFYWSKNFDKPIIGPNFGLLGLEISEYKNGILFDISLKDDLNRVLAKCSKDYPKTKPDEKGSDEEIVRFDGQIFAKSIFSMIESL